jgi:hypothetical protein
VLCFFHPFTSTSTFINLRQHYYNCAGINKPNTGWQQSRIYRYC